MWYDFWLSFVNLMLTMLLILCFLLLALLGGNGRFVLMLIRLYFLNLFSLIFLSRRSILRRLHRDWRSAYSTHRWSETRWRCSSHETGSHHRSTCRHLRSESWRTNWIRLTSHWLLSCLGLIISCSLGGCGIIWDYLFWVQSACEEILPSLLEPRSL